MSEKQEVLDWAQNIGVVCTRDIKDRGISKRVLSGLCRTGQLTRLRRGVYSLMDRHPEYISQYQSYVEASVLVPHGVICLLSALGFHGLTTQLVPDIWMSVPRSRWGVKSASVPIRYIHAEEKYFKSGIDVHYINGTRVAIYDPAKTVVDCFRHRNKVGMDVALEALREYLDRYRSTDKLWRYAKDCRMSRVMYPYLEALS